MTENVNSQLVQDIEDLLDAGAVGLYEFIWTLRSELPDAPIDRLRDLAAAALQHLIKAREVDTVLLVWPHSDPIGTFDANNLTVTVWDDPVENQPYPALILKENAPLPESGQQ
ncbi:hypothetical protein MSTE_01193 [Mycobacteroides stephanolepidis]|uniref:Uncharacterized protein n=1 Tax=[Mycobacterium] stephanolepidis TaxID=1520670 RepID=A0A1Z4EUB3_9MYCO|nr:hypothetical protein [[Mycobacterium] stephanolepidis]BAX96523.1 hypothetical protein MSTE_01193 [[Mycobacterium] stephanolepidis]